MTAATGSWLYPAAAALLVIAVVATPDREPWAPERVAAPVPVTIGRAPPAMVPAKAAPARRADPLPAKPPTPASASPTAAQLAALRTALMIPVAGVHADDLRDTFSEMRGKRRHSAVDILAPRGTAVVAAAAGRVVQISSSESGGLMVFASDASGKFMMLYAHLERYVTGLAEGMPLVRGQPLGEVGTSGNAPPGTPHLHFAIAWTGGSQRWSKGLPIDPRALLMAPVQAAAHVPRLDAAPPRRTSTPLHQPR